MFRFKTQSFITAATAGDTKPIMTVTTLTTVTTFPTQKLGYVVADDDIADTKTVNFTCEIEESEEFYEVSAVRSFKSAIKYAVEQ